MNDIDNSTNNLQSVNSENVPAINELNLSDNDLIGRIFDADTKDELQKQFDLFNINQSKKNAIRAIKLRQLLDTVETQAIERFKRHPDQVSNKELLDYISVIADQIDKAQKSISDIDKNIKTPVINNQKNEVNINLGPELDRDSKERVVDAISTLIHQIALNSNQNKSEIVETPIIIDNYEINQEDSEIDSD